MSSQVGLYKYLAIIVETSPRAWVKYLLACDGRRPDSSASPDHSAPTKLTLPALFEHVLVFVSQYLHLSRQNRVAIFGDGERCELIYPSLVGPEDWGFFQENVHQCTFIDVCQAVEVYMRSIVVGDQRSTNLASSLIRALLFLNSADANSGGRGVDAGTDRQADDWRYDGQASASRLRILVIRLSGDDLKQHISVMNCAFAAQKKGAVIDVCMILPPKPSGAHNESRLCARGSPLLQQVAEITGGAYLHADCEADLVRHLSSVFIAEKPCRQISLKEPMEVDHRMVCFNHHRRMGLAFVCSTCLMAACEWQAICSFCHSRADG